MRTLERSTVTATTPPVRLSLTAANRAVAHALPAFVLVQAVMAGRSERLFGTWSIVAHGILGNVTFLLAVTGLALALLGKPGRPAVLVAGLLVLLLSIQIGMGYAGRTSLGAAAWHIPNGVAIFGLAVYNVTLFRRPA
jgi:hypothetical protein